MKNGPFEDVFPIGDGIFHCYVSLPEGNALFLGVHVMVVSCIMVASWQPWIWWWIASATCHSEKSPFLKGRLIKDCLNGTLNLPPLVMENTGCIYIYIPIWSCVCMENINIHIRNYRIICVFMVYMTAGNHLQFWALGINSRKVLELPTLYHYNH